MSERITLHETAHTVEPIRPINEYKSRFAWRITLDGKSLDGEYELEAVDCYSKTFTYKRLD